MKAAKKLWLMSSPTVAPKRLGFRLRHLENSRVIGVIIDRQAEAQARKCSWPSLSAPKIRG
jgi:hypothetical protein